MQPIRLTVSNSFLDHTHYNKLRWRLDISPQLSIRGYCVDEGAWSRRDRPFHLFPEREHQALAAISARCRISLSQDFVVRVSLKASLEASPDDSLDDNMVSTTVNSGVQV
jgi:hypothetical protein